MWRLLRIIWRVDKRNPLTVAYRQGLFAYFQKSSKIVIGRWRL